ncbi:hypothetical protein G6L37_05095 [Agrobacterium rubi]|nr:hypothetical protein [Agrobacterium rubi]NTF24732.1 hypothetical protein [Agrobacterium rubi]
MQQIQIDPVIARRMGYEDAVATAMIDASGLPIEFALLPPSPERMETEWTLVIHCDCDPERPDQGSSGIEICGRDQDTAEAYYLERIREVELDLTHGEAIRP